MFIILSVITIVCCRQGHIQPDLVQPLAKIISFHNSAYAKRYPLGRRQRSDPASSEGAREC